MIEIIMLIIFNMLFPEKGVQRAPHKLDMENCFYLDEIDKELKDRDIDAPITNDDFDQGPDW